MRVLRQIIESITGFRDVLRTAENDFGISDENTAFYTTFLRPTLDDGRTTERTSRKIPVMPERTNTGGNTRQFE